MLGRTSVFLPALLRHLSLTPDANLVPKRVALYFDGFFTVMALRNDDSSKIWPLQSVIFPIKLCRINISLSANSDLWPTQKLCSHNATANGSNSYLETSLNSAEMGYQKWGTQVIKLKETTSESSSDANPNGKTRNHRSFDSKVLILKKQCLAATVHVVVS